MTEELLKETYRAAVPPKGMRARVLTACSAAKKRKYMMQRRMASMAACLVVVLGLAVYGLSPMPALTSDGVALAGGVLNVVPQTIMVQTGMEPRAATAFTVSPTALGETAEDCIPLTLERAAAVDVSAGALYVFDPLAGTATAVDTPCKAEAGAQLYWQCAEEGAELTLRAGIRTLTLTLLEQNGVYTLEK